MDTKLVYDIRFSQSLDLDRIFSQGLGKPEVILKNMLYYRYKAKNYDIYVILGADHVQDIRFNQHCIPEPRSRETGSGI